MQPSFTDQGIILKNYKYREADKVITILSKHHGLVVFRAPGVRRVTSKKAGHLDSLNLIKFHTARSRSPQILTQAETIDNFFAIKQDFILTKKAFFCAEVINQLAPPEETDQSLFESFKNLLTALRKNKTADRLLVKFLVFLLRHFGYPLPQNKNVANLISQIEEITNRQLKTPHL